MHQSQGLCWRSMWRYTRGRGYTIRGKAGQHNLLFFLILQCAPKRCSIAPPEGRHRLLLPRALRSCTGSLQLTRLISHIHTHHNSR